MERQVVGNNALGRGSIRPLDIRPLRVNPSDMSTIRFRPPVSPPSAEQVRDEVRRHYATAANPEACCENEGKGGCGDRNSATDATSLGYTEEEIAALPEGADLGLGCGNPQAIAALKPGETVLDLGSGAGFDCFLAARAVGPTGRSLGVDMTHEMLAKARATALRAGFANTEFRLGEIEALPVADASVDVIISNCVVNLSPDKPRVLREAFRVLKPGGRLAIADIVKTAELPPAVAASLAALCGCVAGASRIDELEAMLRAAGFESIRIQPKDESRAFIRRWVPGTDAGRYVVSASIEALKPGSTAGAQCREPNGCD